MYLRQANFTAIEAAEALEFALETAQCPPIPQLSGKVSSLQVVVDAVQEVKKGRDQPVRLIIDRYLYPNSNYKELVPAATWFLLVTSLSAARGRCAAR